MTVKRDMFTQQRQPGGHISAHPLPSSEELKRYYEDLYYTDASVRPATYQETYSEDELEHRRLKARQHVYASAAQIKKKSPCLIDVGFGEGFVLAAAVDQGWQVEGVEFTDSAIRRWHPHLLDKIRTGDAFLLLDEAAEQRQQYDVVMLNNVLEHVIDPFGLMRRLRRIVAPDGVLVVTIPNDDSPLQGVLRDEKLVDRDYWFSPPDHLHYFNVETGRRFFADNRWMELDCYAGFPIEMFLLHSGSNYVRDKANGKPSHFARVKSDLLMARAGMPAFHRYCQALAGVGMGRIFTVILKPCD